MHEQISGHIASVSREGLNYDVTFDFVKKGRWNGEFTSAGFVEPYVYDATLDDGRKNRILVTESRAIEPGSIKGKFINYVW